MFTIPTFHVNMDIIDNVEKFFNHRYTLVCYLNRRLLQHCIKQVQQHTIDYDVVLAAITWLYLCSAYKIWHQKVRKSEEIKCLTVKPVTEGL